VAKGKLFCRARSIYVGSLRTDNATEIIEWFYNYRKLTELSLEEVLKAIKIIWISANYFRSIRCERTNLGVVKVVFAHDLNDIKYSQYWGKYFQTFFKTKLGLDVQVLCRPQIFHLEFRGKPAREGEFIS